MANKTKIPFTPEQIAEMRRMYLEEGLTLKKIGERFGVSPIVIRNRLDSSVPVIKENLTDSVLKEAREQAKNHLKILLREDVKEEKP